MLHLYHQHNFEVTTEEYLLSVFCTKNSQQEGSATLFALPPSQKRLEAKTKEACEPISQYSKTSVQCDLISAIFGIVRFWLLSQIFWFSAILYYSFRNSAVFIFCHISKNVYSNDLERYFHICKVGLKVPNQCFMSRYSQNQPIQSLFCPRFCTFQGNFWFQ